MSYQRLLAISCTVLLVILAATASVIAGELSKDSNVYSYPCETLDGWGVIDITGKISQDELSVTRRKETFKTGSGALEWKSPGQKNLFKGLTTPVILANFKLLELDLWSKEKALLALSIDDRDGASFNCPIELKGGEWRHLKLTPTDFKLNDDSKVKKATLDPTKLTSGFALVYMDPFLGSSHPNTFRLDSLSLRCGLTKADRNDNSRSNTINTLTCSAQSQLKPSPADPPLSEATFSYWKSFISPTKEELVWETLPWMTKLWEARAHAQKQGKPVMFWSMAGHPLGGT